MDLSVIIVNYNVRHFLEQCLAAVERAAQNLQAEVWVVDNASADGSVEYLRPLFPKVHFIANKTNSGFAKANNQAVAQAKGKHILFLNPDTLVPEDAFTKCLDFFDTHPDCGALGVRMVDGSGSFLKESKRSFPSPVTSFYKLTGLTRLFPRSATFARYHLGHLDEHATHEVDVLAGAFMMVRKEILDQHGSFDDTFFMYGEDVDLSYRIQKAGYRNYYYPGVTIIHFKGESTRRGSLNYVKMFYNAMSIFVKKHYGQARAGTFSFFIRCAIWLRAAISGMGRFIRKIGLPLIDAGLILLSIWVTKLFWFAYVKPDVRYVREVLIVAASIYTLLYIVVGYFAGLYDRPYKHGNLNRSALAATVILLAVYGLLPEQYRFSRGIIFSSAVLIFLTLSIQRWILVKTGILESAREADEEKQTVVIGSAAEYEAVQRIFIQAGVQDKLLGRIDPAQDATHAIGTLEQWDAIARSLSFKEIIFCQGVNSYASIIEQVQQVSDRYRIRFFASGLHSIIGSDSKDSSGDSLTALGKLNLANPAARRCKRMADVLASLFFIVLYPLLVWGVRNKGAFLKNAWQVLAARKTWVGYALPQPGLPALKPGILASNGWPHTANTGLSAEVLEQVDLRYAKHYRCRQDIALISRRLSRLGG